MMTCLTLSTISTFTANFIMDAYLIKSLFKEWDGINNLTNAFYSRLICVLKFLLALCYLNGLEERKYFNTEIGK